MVCYLEGNKNDPRLQPIPPTLSNVQEDMAGKILPVLLKIVNVGEGVSLFF